MSARPEAPPVIGYEPMRVVLANMPYDYSRYAALESAFSEDDVNGQEHWRDFCLNVFDHPKHGVLALWPHLTNWQLLFDAYLFAYRSLHLVVTVGGEQVRLLPLHKPGALNERWTWTSFIRSAGDERGDDNFFDVLDPTPKAEILRSARRSAIMGRGGLLTVHVIARVDGVVDYELERISTDMERRWKIDYAGDVFGVDTGNVPEENVFVGARMWRTLAPTDAMRFYRSSAPEAFDRRAALEIRRGG